MGLDYDHEWSRRYPARLVRAAMLDNLTRPLAQLVVPTTVHGSRAPSVTSSRRSSWPTTPAISTPPSSPPSRWSSATAPASDYFFDRTWKSVLWSLSLAIPIERSRVNRRSAEHHGRAGEQLEPGDLPRGRSLPGRLAAGIPRRRRLPGPARAGPSCRCTSTAPETCWPRTQRPRTVHRVGRGQRQAARTLSPGARHSDVRARPPGGGGRPPPGRPDRTGRLGARRGGPERLVDGEAPAGRVPDPRGPEASPPLGPRTPAAAGPGGTPAAVGGAGPAASLATAGTGGAVAAGHRAPRASSTSGRVDDGSWPNERTRDPGSRRGRRSWRPGESPGPSRG